MILMSGQLLYYNFVFKLIVKMAMINVIYTDYDRSNLITNLRTLCQQNNLWDNDLEILFNQMKINLNNFGNMQLKFENLNVTEYQVPINQVMKKTAVKAIGFDFQNGDNHKIPEVKIMNDLLEEVSGQSKSELIKDEYFRVRVT